MQPFNREYEQRLMDLMMLAVERPAPEWRGFLESACDDAALIEDVLSTLSEKDQLGDFLEKPALFKLGELSLADLAGPGVSVGKEFSDLSPSPLDTKAQP